MAVSKNTLKQKYSHLDQLSTEDLKAILRTAALSAETDDLDLVDHILEVIVLQEKQQDNVLEIEQAREDFEKLYRNLDEPLYGVAGHEMVREEFPSPYTTGAGRTDPIYHLELEEVKESIPELSKHDSKWEKSSTIRKRFIIAALIAALLAVTMIPVSGYANVLQMAIAYWTDDYFSFAPDRRSSPERTQNSTKTIPEGFADLWNFAVENEIQDLMIPQYIPDGFQVSDVALNDFDLTKGFEFFVLYAQDDNYIGINIIKSDEASQSIYEKDKSNIETYELGDATYFMYHNSDECISSMYHKGIEYSFRTTLTTSELKEVIDSMR